MNIFVLDKNPKKAAEYHCNKHVVKMILESCQMVKKVCTAKDLQCIIKVLPLVVMMLLKKQQLISEQPIGYQKYKNRRNNEIK